VQELYAPGGTQKLAQITAGTPTKIYVPLPGGAVAAYGSSGLVSYRHPDWLGSMRFVSTPSRTFYYSGAYAPFGEWYSQTGTTTNTFTGVGADTENGQFDFLYRRYSPVQGRWISPDRAGLAVVRPRNPQSWNRYAYVTNRPLNHVDAVGMEEMVDSSEWYFDWGSSSGDWFGNNDPSVPFAPSDPTAPSDPNNNCQIMECISNPSDNTDSNCPVDTVCTTMDVRDTNDPVETINNLGNNVVSPNNGSNGIGAPNNATSKQQQSQQPQHFWQKPGCGSALGELGVGTVGTALTVGALVASAYLGPEMYEGLEGVATVIHVGPVGVPGLILMGQGGYGVVKNCF
jgi:RHS repeat-associated protein